MHTSIDYAKHSQEALQHMRGLNAYLGNTLNLVFIRASQINGCKYCIGRHTREAVLGARARHGCLPCRSRSPVRYSTHERRPRSDGLSCSRRSEMHGMFRRISRR